MRHGLHPEQEPGTASIGDHANFTAMIPGTWPGLSPATYATT
jgi:hypothetical protein